MITKSSEDMRHGGGGPWGGGRGAIMRSHMGPYEGPKGDIWRTMHEEKP